MRRTRLLGAVVILALAGGCWWRDKEPENVFPGTRWYNDRCADMEISPEQARRLAYGRAREHGRTQFVSQRPQVIYGREYVFSMPTAEGANLRGYHVNGDTGEVRFYEKDTVLQP